MWLARRRELPFVPDASEGRVVGARDRQDRAGRAPDHLFGDASQEEVGQAAAAVGAHDDQVDVVATRMIQDLLGRLAVHDARVHGHRAVAVSLVQGDDYSYAASVLDQLADLLLRRSSPFPRGTGPGVLLNVNVPGGRPKGVQWTKLGKRDYGDHVIKRKGPKKNTYYWINGGPMPTPSRRGTDVSAVRGGYVSITPLVTDLTDTAAHDALKAGFARKVKIGI